MAWGGHPVDPQVTDLFLSYGCRTNLDGYYSISDTYRLDQILRETPIHLSLLYRAFGHFVPPLTKIMELDAASWEALGYDETDRVSVTRYLGSLKCRTDDALSVATRSQHPLTPELVKVLIDAGAFDKRALSIAALWQRPLTPELAKTLIDTGAFDKSALSEAARYQQPLTLELVKLLIDAGCDPSAQTDNGWDALVYLAWGGHSVDPQVTDLLLSAGCRTDLDGCRFVDEKHRLRFEQILKEHAEWKEDLSRMSAENSLTDTFYGPDWGR